MSLPVKVQNAVDALINSPGATELPLRRRVLDLLRRPDGNRMSDSDIPRPLEQFLEKISASPWTITDRDFAGLRAAGYSYSDDQLYEFTLAAAVGAGLRRFDAGLRALAEDQTQ